MFSDQSTPLQSYLKVGLWRWGFVHEGMDRMCIIPRNKLLNIYLHRFNGPDQDRDMHDHPWWSISFLLRGWIIEKKNPDNPIVVNAPRFYLRSPKLAHTIVDGSWPDKKPITLFITGPATNDWGFYTKDGWRQHEDYLDERR
jgi:hypothetical protein